MEQKSLSKWLKLIIIGVGLCGLAVYGLVIPAYGRSLVSLYPECSNRYRPWLVFLLATGLPCYTVLALVWRIADTVGEGRSFCIENARRLAWISRLAAGDAAFLFIENAALLLMSMNHPSVFLPLLYSGRLERWSTKYAFVKYLKPAASTSPMWS